MKECAPFDTRHLGFSMIGTARARGQPRRCNDFARGEGLSNTILSLPRGRRRRYPSTPTSSMLMVLVLSFLVCSPFSVESFVNIVVPARISDHRVRNVVPTSNGCARSTKLPCQQRRSRTASLPSVAAGGSGEGGRGRGRTGVLRHSKTASKMVAAVPDPGQKTRESKSMKKNRGKRGKRGRVQVTSAADLRQLLSEGRSFAELDVRGDSQDMLASREDEHPVLELMRKRLEAGTEPGSHGDAFKLGLAIEGGGMRGCVSAGMIAAIYNLGLMDTFDAVYGSSAGSLVGAYAIAGQEGMPRLGCSVYYDTLTGKGRHFIDKRYVVRAMGLGLFGTVLTRWRGLKELFQKWGSPVLKLDYLLRDVVEAQRPLDWEGFWQKQTKQPLHVIASGVGSKKPVVMSSKGGHFKTLRELTECMRASMLLPGIAGPMVSLPNVGERLVDSQLYEPIPFRTALDDGCTHVLVVRSRPDGGNLLGKPKLLELLVMRRFFKRKHNDPESYYYMKRGGHKELYAESVLMLNEAAAAKGSDKGPFLLPMCLPACEAEIGRLERGRENILEGVRKGYEHAHVLLSRANERHPTAAFGGRQAALRAFPDAILDDEMDPIVREIMERQRTTGRRS